MTSLDVSPSSVSTRRSQWSCASLRLCSSREVRGVVFRETHGRGEDREDYCYIEEGDGFCITFEVPVYRSDC